MTDSGSLPDWRRVLAVVAHPDDESFGLGALLSTFAAAGAEVHVLCLTRGEASTLRRVEGDLATIREDELRAAADALGVRGVDLRDLPDHVAATDATVRVAERHDLPVLAWTLPEAICGTLADEGFAGFLCRPPTEIDLELTVDRTAQRAAVECHPSQAVPGSVLWRRLELQGDTEHLRWLHRP